MIKPKLVAVSYVNTLPFIKAIEDASFNEVDVELQHPADCAQAAINGEADIALVPVAVLNKLKNYRVITDFCIGCEGAVDTVMVYAKKPITQVKKIYLDYQSKTSVQLVKIIAKNAWKIDPEWVAAKPGYEKEFSDDEAVLVIGDRAFEMNGKYGYQYDLGNEWNKWTGLPFVFAVWVAKSSVSDQLVDRFNQVITRGMKPALWGEQSKEVMDYLLNSISYSLDNDKQKGLQKFLELLPVGVPSV